MIKEGEYLETIEFARQEIDKIRPSESSPANELIILYKFCLAECSSLYSDDQNKKKKYLEAIEYSKLAIDTLTAIHPTPQIPQEKIDTALDKERRNLASALSNHAKNLFQGEGKLSEVIEYGQAAIDVLNIQHGKALAEDKNNITTYQFNLGIYYAHQGEAFYSESQYPEAFESLIAASILFNSIPVDHALYKKLPLEQADRNASTSNGIAGKIAGEIVALPILGPLKLFGAALTLLTAKQSPPGLLGEGYDRTLKTTIGYLKELLETNAKDIPYRKILDAMESFKKLYPLSWGADNLEPVKTQILKTLNSKVNTFLQDKPAIEKPLENNKEEQPEQPTSRKFKP